jgi:hypothetical protein
MKLWKNQRASSSRSVIVSEAIGDQEEISLAEAIGEQKEISLVIILRCGAQADEIVKESAR